MLVAVDFENQNVKAICKVAFFTKSKNALLVEVPYRLREKYGWTNREEEYYVEGKKILLNKKKYYWWIKQKEVLKIITRTLRNE